MYIYTNLTHIYIYISSMYMSICKRKSVDGSGLLLPVETLQLSLDSEVQSDYTMVLDYCAKTCICVCILSFVERSAQLPHANVCAFTRRKLPKKVPTQSLTHMHPNTFMCIYVYIYIYT